MSHGKLTNCVDNFCHFCRFASPPALMFCNICSIVEEMKSYRVGIRLNDDRM